MTTETKKQRPRKRHITRKVREITHQKAIPPFPQVPPVQSSKRPGQDFYLYVNNNWLQKVKSPSYRPAFGVSEELEEVIKEQLMILLEKGIDFAKRGNTARTIYEKAFQMVGYFGMSALRPSVQVKSIYLLKKMINDINCIRDTNDICKTMALFEKMRVSSLFTFYTYFEPGRSIRNRCALSSGRLGLPDPSYYNTKGKDNQKTLSLYGDMLDKVSHLLGLDEILSKVISIEIIFTKEYMKSRYQKDILINGSELPKRYTRINWPIFWETLGYKDWRSNTIRLYPPGWIKSIDSMLETLPLEDWKLLLKTHLILHSLSLLPPPFDDIHSNFFEKHLRGQVRKYPQKALTIRLIETWMPNTMSRLYLKYFLDARIKSESTHFVKTIQKAAINRIHHTSWLSEKTRDLAIEKVEKMKMGIAYPDKMPPLESAILQTDNLLQNILLLGEENTNIEIAKANKVIDIENEWDDAIYAVNAYYYSEVNQLILPAGYLQWPFYHPMAPLGWNYGSLGAIIGHEMTHAFDSDGKDYNWEGIKVKWWTPNDNREYNKRTKALIKLYNNTKVLDHPVNGNLTLNENISDLGGLAIALDALKLECHVRKLTPEKQREAYRNFFISYAVSWRIKEKPEKILQGLFMDRHAPAPLRVNLIVSQFDEWYEAFPIEVKDELYIPPEERIRIF